MAELIIWSVPHAIFSNRNSAFSSQADHKYHHLCFPKVAINGSPIDIEPSQVPVYVSVSSLSSSAVDFSIFNSGQSQ